MNCRYYMAHLVLLLLSNSQVTFSICSSELTEGSVFVVLSVVRSSLSSSLLLTLLKGSVQ